ncbi:hypothetical protein [Hypericibacter sp.]|uniref:hypothetical protein n=1 Tax=Hypericibacter sp. TaxID=2705401 RepID=UPI003D6D091F
MLDPRQFLRFVIRPALDAMQLGGASAEVLLLGTGLAESNQLTSLRQIGKDGRDGPARGLFQMEPATHDDIWDRYLNPSVARIDLVYKACGIGENRGSDMLMWNLRYAAAMTRFHYLRVAEPIPAAHDAEAMAQYHKRHYNTALGKADPARNVQHFLLANSIVGQTR